MVGLSAPRLRAAQGLLAWLSDIPMVATGYVPVATMARVVGVSALATGAATGVSLPPTVAAADAPGHSDRVSAATARVVGAQGSTAVLGVTSADDPSPLLSPAAGHEGAKKPFAASIVTDTESAPPVPTPSTSPDPSSGDSGSGNSGSDDSGSDNSGSDNSGTDDNNSGSGSDNSGTDDNNSGSGSDNSGTDNSNSGSGSDDNNSGSGSDDNSGSGHRGSGHRGSGHSGSSSSGSGTNGTVTDVVTGVVDVVGGLLGGGQQHP
jgi:hypothetical protein